MVGIEAVTSSLTRRRFAVLTPLALHVAAQTGTPEPHGEARRRMVSEISQLIAAGAGGPRERIGLLVLEVMRRPPRHLFVPESLRARAYESSALPIGHGATISQPFIVALMTDLLEPRPTDVVLEVGTGSGYQAAVLSPLVRQVFTIEIIEALAAEAAARLAELGYANVTVRSGDGYLGLPEQAPFDKIILTAGAERIPPALLAQLKLGGRMVIPLGKAAEQKLAVVEKDASGGIRIRRKIEVNFLALMLPNDSRR
ncbi:MAG TPA: protein-L-isoaspartate(D-aspartate) O-methyltransferase [Caulobacteraceae bacterium]|jgi:protein-L-isoaspartate(D-aspartate) O-methyltransferase